MTDKEMVKMLRCERDMDRVSVHKKPFAPIGTRNREIYKAWAEHELVSKGARACDWCGEEVKKGRRFCCRRCYSLWQKIKRKPDLNPRYVVGVLGDDLDDSE